MCDKSWDFSDMGGFWLDMQFQITNYLSALLFQFRNYFAFIQVVGVAQIINKMPGPVPFTEEDEEVK